MGGTGFVLGAEMQSKDGVSMAGDPTVQELKAKAPKGARGTGLQSTTRLYWSQRLP